MSISISGTDQGAPPSFMKAIPSSLQKSPRGRKMVLNSYFLWLVLSWYLYIAFCKFSYSCNLVLPQIKYTHTHTLTHFYALSKSPPRQRQIPQHKAEWHFLSWIALGISDISGPTSQGCSVLEKSKNWFLYDKSKVLEKLPIFWLYIFSLEEPNKYVCMYVHSLVHMYVIPGCSWELILILCSGAIPGSAQGTR